MTDTAYHEITTLRLQLKAERQKVAALESGEAVKKRERELQNALRAENAAKKKAVSELKKELKALKDRYTEDRRKWYEEMQEKESGFEKERALLEEQNRLLLEEVKRLRESARASEEELAQVRKEKDRRIRELEKELEEKDGQIRKLENQLSKDFTNSSIPSSLQQGGRKKIPNSREATDRKRGGQPGHPGHGRRKLTPTQVVTLEDPQELLTDQEVTATDDAIVKQLIGLRVEVMCTEYRARLFRNRKTGKLVHAPFPEGVVNDVNYDGSIKAFAYLMTEECDVSVAKTRRFLKELTRGQMTLSTGMISSLCKEFSRKSKKEQEEIQKELLASPVMNADFTNANVDGHDRQVLILASASSNAVLYAARQKKGHAGVCGTPLEHYNGICVHDHDVTFYNYGSLHQECHQHNLRYLKGCIENEPERTWAPKMQELIRKMIHYRNVHEGALDEEEVAAFEHEYDLILALAAQEYEKDPPNKYEREGLKLSRRLAAYKDSELLFLHDPLVPTNNSLCERLARVYKRRQKQMIVIRSEDAFAHHCDGLSVLQTKRMTQETILEDIIHIFERVIPNELQD